MSTDYKPIRVRAGTVMLRSAWLSLMYYAAAAVLGVSLVMNATAVTDGERAISALDSAEEKTDSLVKRWLERFSLGLYKGATEKAELRTRIESAASHHRERVNLLALSLAACSVLYLYLVWFAMRQRAPASRPRLLTHLHGVAAVCLMVGLIAPMLTVVAQREVAMLGKVVLHYESKSIIDTVRALFARGNLFVAALLGLFSVVVPTGKLLLSLAALLAPSAVVRARALAVVRVVGKWSMTDVFVVAILLAFLALGEGGLTDARLGPGLYFFAAYGLLSMTGGLLLARHVATLRTAD